MSLLLDKYLDLITKTSTFNQTRTQIMTQLLKDISLEQAQMARLYAGTLHKPKIKIERGFFGIIKGDTMTFVHPSGLVETRKMEDFK